jgi:CRISPR-associated endonuclease/helicase Cas3
VLHTLTKAPDPVYGSALEPTWEWLQSQAEEEIVDVGPLSLADPPAETLAPVAHAPILFPAYVDRLVQTSPLPDPEPAVSVFLHGFETQQADIQIVWRADLDPGAPSNWRDIVALVPPSGREALRISFPAATRWLGGLPPADVTDVEGESAEQSATAAPDGLVLRWRGAHDEGTSAVRLSDLRPGDTIVVAAARGGCDREGWAPTLTEHVFDVVEQVAAERDNPVLRLHPSVLAQHGIDENLAGGVLAPDDDDPSVLVPDGDAIHRALSSIAEAESEMAPAARTLLEGSFGALAYPDLRGVLVSRRDETAALGDDAAELAGGEVLLRGHQSGVADEADRMARAIRLDNGLVQAIEEAAHRHDEGKRDPRFQRLLAGGSPLAGSEPLAKGRVQVRDARALRQAWREAGLPRGFRHETASTALVDGLDAGVDGDLVRHLVASHHGCARPYLPAVQDPMPLIDTSDLERVDGEVPERFWRLIRRYGWWGLAYLEAVLRLADHRQSARERS